MCVCWCVRNSSIKPVKADSGIRGAVWVFFIYIACLEHHDVPLQRSAAASLPGFPASSPGSLLTPQPLFALRLPGGRSAPAEPARRLHPPGFLLREPRGAYPDHPGPGCFCPCGWFSHRTNESNRVTAPPHGLLGLWIPEVRRQCHPGPVHTER